MVCKVGGEKDLILTAIIFILYRRKEMHVILYDKVNFCWE